MPESLKKVMSKIEKDKEVLSTFPVNTKKNKKIYVNKLEEIKGKYEEYNNDILKKMKEIYNENTNFDLNNDKLNEKKKQIEEVGNVENIINDKKNTYEKMGIDKVIYNLKRFYRKNLEIINADLKTCIELFEDYSITLTADDFCFTEYTKEYMAAFLEEIKKEEIDSKRLKNLFEEIYWKSPDLITHIQLNMRYIFLKRENEIEKILKWQENRVNQKLAITREQIISRYNTLRRDFIEEMKSQNSNIVNKFLDGYWNIKDYDEKNINKYYSKFISLDVLKENEEEINQNLIGLLHNLHEFDNYTRYKFIFDDIKQIYTEEKAHENDKNKETYTSVKKEIVSHCKKICKKNIFMNAKKSEKAKIELLNNLSKLFDKLDELEVREKVFKKLDMKSNVKEMGDLASVFYKYMFLCMIKEDKDITEEEIKVKIEEFTNFVKYPYDTISASITMEENKDIPLMIKDRYNLFRLNITKEMLDENNIGNLILDLQKIEKYYYMKKNNIDLKEIEYLCKTKKILNDNDIL